MKSPSPQISTCSTCGAVLEETGDLGCMVCLLQVGLNDAAQVGENASAAADDRFGIYVIERHDDGSLHELGRGAMGVTFCAVDTSLQRKVALKIISTDPAARRAEARERFMRGARAAAALRHENVATIYHFGIREETGQFFYAMELVEGETLEERVRRSGPMDARTAIAVGQQVAEALSAAEKRGLVHRDLKPANLMLVNNDLDPAKPVVKVIDFGLAKALTVETDPMALTHGGFVGTPAFASPEQFAGAAIDVRSDIYSLGLTLWFALTGKNPFGGRSLEEIQRGQQAATLPIQQLQAADIPWRLIALLKSMLAVEPAARPGTQELIAQLQRCHAQTTGLRKPVRLAIAGGIVVILGVAGFMVFRPPQSVPSSPTGIGVKKQGINPVETSNPKAHEAYLKGRYFWSKRTQEAYLEAKPYFEKAIALDPNFAQAYAGLADAYLLQADYDSELRRDYFAQAKAANRRALELDPDLAAAHASLGLIAMSYDWDWPMAEKEFKRALELDPKYSTAHHWYGEFLLYQGRFEESFREMGRARDLDPLSLIINTDFGKALYFARRMDDAETQLKEALKMEPNFVLAHMWLASVYTARQRFDEAIAECNNAARLGHPITALEGRGYVYAVAGKKNDVEQTIIELNRHLGGKAIQIESIAYMHIGLGEKDQAFACLEAEYAARSTALVSLKVNPAFDPLRDDPRFADFMRRMRLGP
jgi:serine/threonine protein kinase/Tfp pilus assembly protein PilF